MDLFVEFLKTNAALLAIPYAMLVVWLVIVARKAKSVFTSEMRYLPPEIRAYRGWALNKDETQIKLGHRTLARLVLWGNPPEIELAPLPEEQLLRFRIAYALIILPAPVVFSLYAPDVSMMNTIAIGFLILILIWRPWPWRKPRQ